MAILNTTPFGVRQGRYTRNPFALPTAVRRQIRLEAGPLSQWLYSVLAEAGLPVICVQINKTDRNDARGIAQMMRVGLYRAVHVKTLRSQKLRVLLTHRKLLQSKTIAMARGGRIGRSSVPSEIISWHSFRGS